MASSHLQRVNLVSVEGGARSPSAPVGAFGVLGEAALPGATRSASGTTWNGTAGNFTEVNEGNEGDEQQGFFPAWRMGWGEAS